MHVGLTQARDALVRWHRRRPQHPSQDVLERWERVWHGVFYFSLGLGLILALLDGPSLDRAALLAALTAALAAWYTVMIVRWSCDDMTPGHILVFFLGEAVMLGTLAWLDASFLVMSFAIFVQLFAFIPPTWATAGVIALTLILFTRDAALDGQYLWENEGALLGAVFSVIFTIISIFFFAAITRQSQERKRLIDELMATRAALAERERQAGIIEERQRLAREIHDTLAQGFTSIVMHLEAAEPHIPAEATALRRHVEQARATARDSLNDARRLVWALRPEQLEQGGSLADALARVAERWSEDTGITAHVTVDGTPVPLPPDVEVTLFRITQEALANVRKHAQAGRVDITLSYLDDEVLLDVQDDGVGFDRATVSATPGSVNGGFGLTGMRERLRLLGGSLMIESAPGEGTSITVALPLADRVEPRTERVEALVPSGA
jgi:signal transduction histidine kinase